MSIFVIEFSCFSRVNSEAEARKFLGKASLPLPKGGLPGLPLRFRIPGSGRPKAVTVLNF